MKGMKGDIFKNVLDIIVNGFIKQTPIKGRTIVRCCGAISYGYWLCCILIKTGYFSRIKNGYYKVVKNPANIKSLKQLRIEAYKYTYNKEDFFGRQLELF